MEVKHHGQGGHNGVRWGFVRGPLESPDQQSNTKTLLESVQVETFVNMLKDESRTNIEE